MLGQITGYLMEVMEVVSNTMLGGFKGSIYSTLVSHSVYLNSHILTRPHLLPLPTNLLLLLHLLCARTPAWSWKSFTRFCVTSRTISLSRRYSCITHEVERSRTFQKG